MTGEDTIAGRKVRIAAVGDLHAGKDVAGTVARQLGGVSREADVLVLCGDLTHHGTPEQMQGLVDELAGIDIPIVAVFGNHDYEAQATDELAAILRNRGIHILDGEQVIIEGIGFVGTKGFCGGFGRYTISPFGEPSLKALVQETLDEALKLEMALRTLTTETKVVVMHFSPTTDTLAGEPRELYPLLGSSRFQPALETHGASVVFHGHAHYGSPEGRTPAGIPVFNVAAPVLEKIGRRFHIWSGRGPERRARRSA